MKAKELRKKSDEELLKMKNDLSYQLIQSKSLFGGQVKTRDKKRKAENPEQKGIAFKGTKTSLQKDIRRNIARINLILHERKIMKNIDEKTKYNKRIN
jgi:ribosomal protein L29